MNAITVDTVLEFAARNNRVCPLPQVWMKLHALLTTKGTGSSKTAPVPLILARWNFTGDHEKAQRLREQIEYAAETGSLTELYDFLMGMSDQDWHYFSD